MDETKQDIFKCPYCEMDLNSYEELKGHMLSEHRDGSIPAPKGQINLNINGSDYTFNVEPDWTLYYLIHDKLGMTGTKQFCDRGACGSCTVIYNGKPVLSCMKLAIECGGATIETSEGIADSEHPIVESYVEHHAMQCGYCTPGFVVASKSLLDRTPNPTVEEIKQALSGNLCRCGTYPQHVTAIQETAQKLQSGKD
jgi:xanthine dehydrogenase YagT iron-sulfur-binding subunit